MVGACPHPKSPLAGFRLAPRRAAGPAPARRRRPPGPRISGGVALAPQLAGAGCTPQPLIQYFYLLIKHCACLPGQHSAAGRPPDPDIRRLDPAIRIRTSGGIRRAPPVVADVAARVSTTKHKLFICSGYLPGRARAGCVGSGNPGAGSGPSASCGARARPSAPPAPHCLKLRACICISSCATARRHAAVARGWWPDPAGAPRAPFR